MLPSVIAGKEHVPSVSHRLTHGYSKFREHSDWATFAGSDWRTRIMSEEVADRFHAKQGRSIGRWTLADSSGAKLIVYLKRHYQLPRIAGLLALLFPGRAWSPGLQEWNNLTWAERLGLPVPRAMAAGEFVGAGGKTAELSGS